MFTAALSVESAAGASVPPDAPRPPDWPDPRLHTVVTRALPARVQAYLRRFLQGMQRRLERDLERVHAYYTDLRQEAWQRLHKQHTDAARERLRLEAAAREYQAKVADLRQKYDLRVTIELEQTLILTNPVQRLELTIKRRKGERRVALDWHPLVRRLDPPPCEWSSTAGSRAWSVMTPCTWSVPPATRHVRSVAKAIAAPASRGAAPNAVRRGETW